MLSALIKSHALELGFAKVGIVPAEALTVEAERLREWLARGYHGEMAWMARDPEKRTDPRVLFPGAKSVIVALMNYHTGRGESPGAVGADGGSAASPQNPKPEIQKGAYVSTYAHGDDYHDVVGDRLRELLAYVEEVSPGAGGKVCVDTSAVMEKAWAARAGLGWIGKHTNLITRELGSWVFIGEILLDIELEYDRIEEQDRCGTCTDCIDACPTGAIVEPYVLDSNRCISYATIELRSPELPEHIADRLEGWLYGCDICQDVCPWNRFEQVSDEERFRPREVNIDPDPEEIARLTPEEFRKRYRGSAMKRTKLAGLVRNAKALTRK